MILLSDYLLFSILLFVISLIGIFINKKNILLLFMCLELMLLSVNTNFIAFSRYAQDMVGEVFVVFILTVAAAEVAIGLAILIILFRRKSSVSVLDIHSLWG